MTTSKTRKHVTVLTAEDLGRALGLSAADTAEMEFRSKLTVALAKIIQAGQFTHAEIAKKAGTSRTRVEPHSLTTMATLRSSATPRQSMASCVGG
jgi:predicted XRE-type DNA-binding protein